MNRLIFVTLVAPTLVGVVHSFVPTASRRAPTLPMAARYSSSSERFASVTSDGNDGSQLHLPPGRKTPRFINFLFDDSLRLLNPKTMGSYQTKRSKEYGDIFKTNIFGKPTVFVTSEETLALLGKEESRSKKTGGTEAFFPPHHQTLFGPNSLLVQSGEPHDLLRRLILPSLSPNLMTTVYQPIVDEALDEFLSGLAAINPEDGDYFQLVPELRSFFISIALQVLLGKSSEVPPGLADDLTIWGNGLLAAPLTFIPWSSASKALRARKRIIDTMAPRMQQARSAGGDDNSLLGRLVSTVDEETGKQLSDEQIMDNVLTLIFAGSDTTASAATSMWLTLSLHPEIKETLKKDPGQVERFVEAILRAYPPAPFSMRLTKQQLSVSGYDIPSGWLVIYGFAGALASKSAQDGGWEAFAASAGTGGDKAASASGSVAFGAGPRMCPGRNLAALELKTLCEKLVEKHDWKLKEDQNLKQTYTPGFFPKDGLQIKFG